MYLEFYNLREKPFNISTDPRFLWYGDKHGEALANLEYGLLEGNGYVVLTGDVGMGKTTLVNALIAKLDDDVIVANINHPTFSDRELLVLIAKTYDPSAQVSSKTECLLFLQSFLHQMHADGKTVLLIIDEAHRLPKESLEEIRLLSNIELTSRKLINIFFVGQNGLKRTLFSPECSALRQRITLFYDIRPLSEKETSKYVLHRLKVAGTTTPLFTSRAIHLIHAFAQGYPRLINIICDRALLAGYVKGQKRIDSGILFECANDIKIHNPELLPAQSLERQSAPVLEPWQGTHPPSPTRSEDPRDPEAQNLDAENKGSIPEPQPPMESDPGRAARLDQRRPIPKSLGLWALAMLTVIAVGIGITYYLNYHNDKSSQGGAASEDEGIESPPDGAAPGGATQSNRNPDGKSEPTVKDASQLEAQSQERQSPTESGSNASKRRSTSVTSSPPPDSGTSPGSTATAKSKPNKTREGFKINPSDSGPNQFSRANRETILDSVSAELEEKNFEKALELIKTQSVQDIFNTPDAKKLYSRALTGRADQIMQSSPSQAEAMLQKALEANPQNVRAYFYQGKIYTQIKEYDQAINAYQNAIRLNPNFSNALFNLGFIHATIGKYEEAEKFFSRTVQLKPSYLGKALFNLSLVQEKLGKKEISAQNLKEALAISPDNPKIRDYAKQAQQTTEASP